jgi:acylphosphatase
MTEEREQTSPRPKARARLRAIVHGRVQGVNFRYYTVRVARQLGLAGWVANRWDGTVETVAEGERQALERFRAFLNRGSPSSTVVQVDVSWTEKPTEEFTTFRVRYL